MSADEKSNRDQASPLSSVSSSAAPASSYTSADPTQPYDTPLAREARDHVDLARRARSTTQLPRPDQTRIFVVANQKGGVGKTTTAVNVAAALAQKGLRVLVVDLDPQGNASTALDIAHTEGTPGVYEALVEDVPLAQLVQPAPQLPGLTVLPATIDLAGAEIELVSLVARETRLKKALAVHLEERSRAGDPIDYVVIDCPPSLGLLTVNALVAAREVLIPIQCEYYALEGLGQLVRNIELVRQHLNQGLEITTILLTMFDARTRLSAGVAEQVRQHFGPKVLATAIPRSVRISEAPSYQQTVVTYDPGSSGALSYLEAAREIAQAASTDPTTSERDV